MSLTKPTTQPSRQSAPNPKQAGRIGENLAAQYLQDQGWEILARNWRPSAALGPGLRGEIDIVAQEPAGDSTSHPTLVIVEVKTRTSTSAGYPAAAVTKKKLSQLRALTAAWVCAQTTPTPRLRVDVISIQLRPGRPAALRHHQGVS